jgi:dolichol-phosphate hexosyltransferase
MSVPQPLSAHGDGDETEGLRLPVPANFQQENILPLLSAIAGGQQYLSPVQPIRHDTVPIKLSILMCAYNEERTITRAVREVLTADYPCEMELLIVDAGSTDATPALLARVNDPRVIVHRHSGNRGKGAALLSAASFASGTHILPFDADLEYSPDDIARVVYPVLIGRCDVVYGARIFGFNTVYHSYKYAVGNRWLTRIANILFNSYLSDLHTCLKLIPMSMFKSLDLSELGFGLDTEVTALLLKAGVRPFEVPVSYYSRTHDQGKKINWRDAVACISILVKVRLLRSPRAKTLAVAPEASERPGEAAGSGWGAVRALAIRDDSRPNAATS